MEPDAQDDAAPKPEPADEEPQAQAPRGRVSRRRLLGYGVGGLACAAGVGWGTWRLLKGLGGGDLSPYITGGFSSQSEVFKNDAPKGKVWELWRKRGWAREARHYVRSGDQVQCMLCPNHCVLSPDDRSRCRGRVNKGGTLYTLGYGNPCSFSPDHVEKKPLYHFQPGTLSWSIAVAGCCLRCLNCQNWEISQAKPEDTKDPEGDEVRPTPDRTGGFSPVQLYTFLNHYRGPLSMFPQDVVRLAGEFRCASIAYTYSEPSVWYEYMYDCCKLARDAHVKNVWVTSGHIDRKPLKELCQYMDAANVDLKSFDDKTSRELNSCKLEPILGTLKILKDQGVWFEVTNLIVPTYTDKLDMIRRMCDWLVKTLGPDYPLHFSRFHPAHKLTRLPPTPVEVLAEARQIARKAGLHHVYIGNVSEQQVDSPSTTRCPQCSKALITRTHRGREYLVDTAGLEGGKCKSCGTAIAGTWKN